MYKFFLFPLLLLVTVSVGQPVFAVDLQQQINNQINKGAEGAGLSGKVTDKKYDALYIVPAVIKILLEIIGTYFMILVILGGWGYINAKGDESEVEKAKETIKGAIIGLIIIMMAYSITLFVSIKFNAAVTQGGTVDQNYNPSVTGR